MQGFQFYVLKFFLLSKRIFEGFELVLAQAIVQHKSSSVVGSGGIGYTSFGYTSV